MRVFSDIGSVYLAFHCLHSAHEGSWLTFAVNRGCESFFLFRQEESMFLKKVPLSKLYSVLPEYRTSTWLVDVPSNFWNSSTCKGSGFWDRFSIWKDLLFWNFVNNLRNHWMNFDASNPSTRAVPFSWPYYAVMRLWALRIYGAVYVLLSLLLLYVSAKLHELLKCPFFTF